MLIRQATPADLDAIWEIFERVVATGDTFAFSPVTKKAELPGLWLAPAMDTFVAESDGKIVGSYFIKPNQPGLGAHIANCGYMVHPGCRGKGIGGELCRHSLQIAKVLGYRGMQFNRVVSTNTGAVALWQRLGFRIIGTVPGGFNHQKLGYVDAFIMFREIG